MPPQSVLYYGHKDPLPEQIELQAGPLAATYEQGDLRYIRLGDTEIIRRIYVAVRDRNWGTVQGVISGIKIENDNNSFVIRYHVEHHQGEIDFKWNGEIQGDPQGKITFSLDGAAGSTFLKNRIGFCILYPAQLSGCPAEVKHTDGTTEKTIFPVDIISDQPVEPFKDLEGIVHEIRTGRWAEITFLGDVFEMEDQRNWTDASFKIFCTPLRLPYPTEIRQGTKISQAITILLRRDEPIVNPISSIEIPLKSSGIELSINRSGKVFPVPAIGLGLASHGKALTLKEIERLRTLSLSHLRVDLPLTVPHYKSLLQQAALQAHSIETQLEAALFVSEDADQQLSAFRREIEAVHPPINAWLCFPQKEIYSGGTPVEKVVLTCRKHLEGFSPSIPFFAGTNNDFIFLKRNIPPIQHVDGISFSICPQVHAFDNASLVETLEVQGTTVENARRLGFGLPVRVSPVTLKMRFNPYATGHQPVLQSGKLPDQVDVRQVSLFAAGWTIGSFKYLAEAGTERITYYETTGWRGVMETEAGSPLPELFPSTPGSVFPIYHALAGIADFSGGQGIPVQSSHPLQVIGCLLFQGQSERILVANFSPGKRQIRVGPVTGQASVRYLDETTAYSASVQPFEYRSSPGRKVTIAGGFFELELKPYAVAIVDIQPDFHPH